jgi:hypothetical protein
LNAQRVAGVTAAIVLMMTLTACGSGEDSEMPDVVGSPLDTAKSDIERAGYGSDLEVLGGGLFGIVDDPRAWPRSSVTTPTPRCRSSPPPMAPSGGSRRCHGSGTLPEQ